MKGYGILQPRFAEGRFGDNVNAESRGLQVIPDDERIASAAGACERLGPGDYLFVALLDNDTIKVLANIQVSAKAEVKA